MFDIIKREGVLGLYSGLSSSLLGIAVTNGCVLHFIVQGSLADAPYRVYYYFYERSRGVILNARSGGKGLSTIESILAGLIAGNASHYKHLQG